MQQQAHHDHLAGEGPGPDTQSQAQGPLHQVELSADQAPNSHISSSHAQAAHETMLADLEVAGQLEAFKSAVGSQADSQLDDDDEDL